jgi:acetyl esterase
MAQTEPDRIVTYKQVDGVSLDLHIFNPPGHSASDEAPAIVLFFGGGWKTGAPKQFYPQSRHFASRGMVAICPDYRTEGRHGTSPGECVKDARSALRWVRSHAVELGVDPVRIVAGGGSAGGHLAAAVALLNGFDEQGEDTSVSPKPSALVLFNPVVDNGPGGYGYERVKAFWKSFSPLHNLDKGAPPTLVMLGTGDHLIPVATAEAYKTKMESFGVRCDLILYEDQPHGFFNQARYQETLQASDGFLVSLGYLPAVK